VIILRFYPFFFKGNILEREYFFEAGTIRLGIARDRHHEVKVRIKKQESRKMTADRRRQTAKKMLNFECCPE
jgi:hypothetical protein